MYLYFSLFIQTQDLSYISEYSSYINQLLSYLYGPISSHQSIYLSVLLFLYLSNWPSLINLSSISLTISYPSIHSILLFIFHLSSHHLFIYHLSFYLSVQAIKQSFIPILFFYLSSNNISFIYLS